MLRWPSHAREELLPLLPPLQRLPRAGRCPGARATVERQTSLVASLVEDVFAGATLARALPDSVSRTLESLDAARGGIAAVAAAS